MTLWKNTVKLMNHYGTELLFSGFFMALSLINSSINIYSLSVNFAYLFLVLSIYTLIPMRFKKLYLIGILAFISLLVFIQNTYYDAFKQYGLISTFLSVATSIMNFKGSIYSTIKLHQFLIFSFLLIFVLFLYSQKTNRLIDIKSHPRTSLTLFILFVFLISGFTFGLNRSGKQEVNNLETYLHSEYYLYHEIPNTNQFVQQFGFIPLLYQDTNRLLSTDIELEIPVEETLKKLLAQKEATERSALSKSLQGKSLWLIEAESLNNMAIHPELTPTLYRLIQEGIEVKGYNSPLLYGSTADTEFIVNTGLLPANNGLITFNTYLDNTYPNTLASSFNEAGYTSKAFHNNEGSFYSRNTMLKNLGYDFMDGEALNLLFGSLDSIAMDAYLKSNPIPEEKHFTFWISYNGHQPYMDIEETLKVYTDRVNELYPDLSEEMKIYLAKNMDFDSALAKLMESYEAAGRLDDLVIVIYGDHIAKDLYVESDALIDYLSTSAYEADYMSTPFILWNHSLEAQKIQKTSSSLDIMPTLFDLFGIEADEQSMAGYSIFDPNYQGFTFTSDGYLKTDHYTYQYFDDQLLDSDRPEYLKDARSWYLKLQLYPKLVELDYFRK